MSPVMVTLLAAVTVTPPPSWMAGNPWPGPDNELMLPFTYNMVSGLGLIAFVTGSIILGTPVIANDEPPLVIVVALFPASTTTVVSPAGLPSVILYTCC